MRWWTTKASPPLFLISSTSLLFPSHCSYMKIYTDRALFSGFIQNTSNEDKLLPGWATMAPPALKRTKMAEWKWEGQRRSGLCINSHITTHTHARARTTTCAQTTSARWGVVGAQRWQQPSLSPSLSSNIIIWISLCPSFSSLNIIMWIAGRWWDVGPGIKLRKYIRRSGITDH